MRLEWIDDILAALDSGSLAQAAERRFVTQSAFTRRVRMIEENIGATLFDRRRKPVTLMPGVVALEPELRELSARLRRLSQDLRLSAGRAGRPLTFVCQHAITTTVSPRVVRQLTATGETSVRVRSGNQDECLLLLLANEADFAIMYEVAEDRTQVISRAFEDVLLERDLLIPVCAPAIRPLTEGCELPVISYPPDVFLGRVFNRNIAPRLPDNVEVVSQAETALTLAVLEFALSEIGIAWLPESLVGADLARGQLVRVDDVLPAQELDVRMIRLSEEPSQRSDAVWHHVIETLKLPACSERLPDAAPGLVQPVERAEKR
ncbi:LysR family transcriptional regulator [Sedimentitalea sp. XS_ASV28]|uniref:LysR family transcriptional regulator n=1 Tax=Sedimentitalea sp. XS_ASV28 TaxID=3241296 RepID=UPI003516188B